MHILNDSFFLLKCARFNATDIEQYIHYIHKSGVSQFIYLINSFYSEKTH